MRFLFLLLFLPLLLVSSADAAPPTCFGKKVERIVRADDTRVRIAFRETTWIEGDNTTVIGKPYSTICADEGNQTVIAGKGISQTSLGAGDDMVRLHQSSWRNTVITGSGSDRVWGSRGHDKIDVGGPGIDTDWVSSGGGNDEVRDEGGETNEIRTGNGSDRIWSLGVQSSVWSGNGTDFIYSNGGLSSSGVREQLFGERGNDRLLASAAPSDGPALLDPGPGDDWMEGTSYGDTLLFQSGLKKVQAGDGDDLLLSSGKGESLVEGGPGTDTASFAAWTPPEEDARRDGLWIIGNEVRGLQLSGWENIIGSAFDDQIEGEPGVRNTIWGGLGDDEIEAQREDGDVVRGGPGRNICKGYTEAEDCGTASRPQSDGLYASLDMSGVLVVRSGSASDDISIDYVDGAFMVTSPSGVSSDGLCQSSNEGQAVCAPPGGQLGSILVYGGDGDDQIRLLPNIPATLTTTLDGGTGANIIQGGPSKDTIQTKIALSAGSSLRGGDGVDNIYVYDDVLADGEAGNDVLHSKNPCVGGSASGGTGRDNLVFAGADAGVWASIGDGLARWQGPVCSAPLSIKSSVESLEGTAHNDFLQLGRSFPEQEGRGQLLGREGIDTLDARNGRRDLITTGSGGKSNRVIRDRIDEVVWGWGLSGF